MNETFAWGKCCSDAFTDSILITHITALLIREDYKPIFSKSTRQRLLFMQIETVFILHFMSIQTYVPSLSLSEVIRFLANIV